MNKSVISRVEFIEIVRGVFPGIRDDVAVLVSNPKYMGKKERSRLRNYQVVDEGLLYEFTASLITCIDDSQMLTIAKYEVGGEEITHLVSEIASY